MRRSSEAVVSPPHMRGITLYVPSFWILAWLRSLMKRLRVVPGFLGRGADQVVDGRAAGGTAIGRAPLHEAEHRIGAQQLVIADRIAHGTVPVVGAAARLALVLGAAE